MPVPCAMKCGKNALLKRPKTGCALCKECFFMAFEFEVHDTIVKGKLFKSGQHVAVGASGGKDSTVLAYILQLLNDRYKYGITLTLLSIDEGITGYRDDSLEMVKQNRDDLKLPLKILSYKDLYGWTMDSIVQEVGKKSNCTYCGVFRRGALERGAALIKADIIATGHNADDMAETVLMNILRGDVARLHRCCDTITQDNQCSSGDASSSGSNASKDLPRVKPLRYCYEKEIVLYAHHAKLPYFSTECIYSPQAYRGHARTFLKDLERIRPSAIMDIIHSGETLKVGVVQQLPNRGHCSRCGQVSSATGGVCKACMLLDSLNQGKPKVSLRKSEIASKVSDDSDTGTDSSTLMDGLQLRTVSDKMKDKSMAW
ncbi:cytoplasmic tRNA 2-thiolation protein 1 [Ischnura elegans]|uniref:cytoplasmic tRNA 2-thiolation protein 1 n=1 Tax=Ischnura elegans TaxID=197161 RepID=UPI001ED8B383|nr:cytoplasmic tRNA 2-thiolation protein 1 [Ischnura elegans]